MYLPDRNVLGDIQVRNISCQFFRHESLITYWYLTMQTSVKRLIPTTEWGLMGSTTSAFRSLDTLYVIPCITWVPCDCTHSSANLHLSSTQEYFIGLKCNLSSLWQQLIVQRIQTLRLGDECIDWCIRTQLEIILSASVWNFFTGGYFFGSGLIGMAQCSPNLQSIIHLPWSDLFAKHGLVPGCGQTFTLLYSYISQMWYSSFKSWIVSCLIWVKPAPV